MKSVYTIGSTSPNQTGKNMASIQGHALLSVAFILIFLTGCSTSPPLSTVKGLNLSQYMGTWYEIGKFPNRFQKACLSDTTASYSLITPDRIKVVNRCRTKSGKIAEAIGLAKPSGRPEEAKLKVSFVKLFGLQLFWGDYWIIGLDKTYQYAVVGNPDRKYGWILSRKPKMAGQDLQSALKILKDAGYDISLLEMTPQEANTDQK
jgi:apolipoprotein D and lipocalin family protein